MMLLMGWSHSAFLVFYFLFSNKASNFCLDIPAFLFDVILVISSSNAFKGAVFRYKCEDVESDYKMKIIMFEYFSRIT